LLGALEAGFETALRAGASARALVLRRLDAARVSALGGDDVSPETDAIASGVDAWYGRLSDTVLEGRSCLEVAASAHAAQQALENRRHAIAAEVEDIQTKLLAYDETVAAKADGIAATYTSDHVFRYLLRKADGNGVVAGAGIFAGFDRRLADRTDFAAAFAAFKRAEATARQSREWETAAKEERFRAEQELRRVRRDTETERDNFDLISDAVSGARRAWKIAGGMVTDAGGGIRELDLKAACLAAREAAAAAVRDPDGPEGQCLPLSKEQSAAVAALETAMEALAEASATIAAMG